jgi:hypothetical protein
MRIKIKLLVIIVEMEPQKNPWVVIGESSKVLLYRSCHAIGFPKPNYITRLSSKVLKIKLTMPSKRKRGHLKLCYP